MIKQLILIATLVFSHQANSQKIQEFTLNKGVTVGCYNANPLTDVSKKIAVIIDNDIAKFSLASIVCKKEYNGNLKVDFGSGATGYFDKKEKRGVIVDGSIVSLFKEEAGKYEIVVAGHEDKKAAKELSTEAQQTKHKAVFDNFDATLMKAQKEADHAAKMAKVLPIPTGDYSDKYGIGGLYYFSELSILSTNDKEFDGKYAQSVVLHLDTDDNNTLKAYYSDGKYDKFYFDGARNYKAFKAGSLTTVIRHKGDNLNSIKIFDDGSMIRLEEGLYLLGRSWFRTSSGCTDVIYSEARGKEQIANGVAKYVLLGKDKKRIDELINNEAELEKLAIATVTAECQLNDALEAAEKPMPAASAMNTGKLKTEATELTKAFAKGRWSQEVVYSFIMGKEWFTLRNKVTGVITGRVISAIAIMKTKDGSCFWEEISIRQDYNGSDYGTSYFGGESTVIIPVDCTTAMKYK